MLRNTILVVAALALGAHPAVAADKAAEISSDSQAALNELYAKVAAAKTLGAKANAILVFPKITRPASSSAANTVTAL